MKRQSALARLSRSQHPFTAICTVSCLVLFVGTAPASFACQKHDGESVRLTRFGDGLSDSGNAAALAAGITFRPFDNLIPDGPYFTYRFTNGRTWVEHLAKSTGSADSAKAAFLFSDVGRNCAVETPARANFLIESTCRNRLDSFSASLTLR